MSQATASTPSVTVVCTGALTATTNVLTASTSMGLAGVLGQNDVGLPWPLSPMGTIMYVGGLAVLLYHSLTLRCLLSLKLILVMPWVFCR